MDSADMEDRLYLTGAKIQIPEIFIFLKETEGG